MRILIEAYACCPGRGSEENNGWCLPLELARAGHAVTVVTKSEHAVEIGTARAAILRGEPQLEPLWNFVFIGTPDWTRHLPHALRPRVRYWIWLRRVPRHISSIAGGHDLLWHLTWGSLFAGTRLHLLGLPLIHGPSGGGQTTDPRAMPLFGRDVIWEIIRSLTVRAMRHTRPAWIRRASMLICSNRETERLAIRMGARRTALCSDATLPESFRPPQCPERSHEGALRLLWIGRLVRLKAVRLAIWAMEALPPELPVSLEILGDGPDAAWLQQALATSPARERITWGGRVPWDEIPRRMRAADTLLLTSVRDSCAAQVFEAMCWGLPVIAIRQFGVRDHAPAEGVCWVRPGPIPALVHDLATSIVRLQRSPAMRQRMSALNHAASREHLWAPRAATLMALIARLRGQAPAPRPPHAPDRGHRPA